MFRDLVYGSLACACGFQACAEERPAKLDPVAGALPVSSKTGPYGAARPRPAAATPVAITDLAMHSAEARSGFVQLREGAAVRSPRIGSADAKALPNWRITEEREQTTAADGGRYAVGDYFSSQRRPRFRRSALGALLVFKIDGQEDSPPLSVGGGGVAAAVWQAVPK